jgi:hypothetical protein
MQAAVAIELDVINGFARRGELLAMVAYLGTFRATIEDLLRNSGLYVPGVLADISQISTDDDIAWFALHRDRSYRLREARADEFVLTFPGALPATSIIVAQVEPGTRLLIAVSDGCTVPAVTPQPFMDDASEGFADRDMFLGQLFDALCRYPGQAINVSVLIQTAHLLSASKVIQ